MLHTRHPVYAVAAYSGGLAGVHPAGCTLGHLPDTLSLAFASCKQVHKVCPMYPAFPACW
jgi:hypothetical protein